MITFFNKTIAKRSPPGQRQSVQNEGCTIFILINQRYSSSCNLLICWHLEYFVHVYMRADGLCACVTCDSEYPARVAFSILTKIMDDFDAQVPSWREETRNEALAWPPLDQAIAKYQDPANADQIMRIQKNLDDTRDVLHQTIDSVLQRGEKLEDLVERSSELSSQSKMFYKQAKKANSCCAVV